MSSDIDRALGVLGIRTDDVDPDVLDGLRKAATRGPKQMTRESLAGLTPEQITAAKSEGRLDTVLGRR